MTLYNLMLAALKQTKGLIANFHVKEWLLHVGLLLLP